LTEARGGPGRVPARGALDGDSAPVQCCLLSPRRAPLLARVTKSSASKDPTESVSLKEGRSYRFAKWIFKIGHPHGLTASGLGVLRSWRGHAVACVLLLRGSRRAPVGRRQDSPMAAPEQEQSRFLQVEPLSLHLVEAPGARGDATAADLWSADPARQA
jgi:hypothetical protein